MRTSNSVLSALVGLVLVAPSVYAQEGAVTFTKGAGAREVQVSVKNTDSACGMQIQFSDGRTERKRIEAGEVWTISHTPAADGNFEIAAAGVTILRGLRTVGPCRHQGAALFAVAGGNATVQVEGAQGVAGGGGPRSGPAPAAAPTTPAPSARGPQQDMIVLLKRDSRAIRFMSTLDGGRKVANADDLVRQGVSVCVLKYPNAYAGISDDAVTSLALAEVGRQLAAMAGSRSVATRQENCIANEGTDRAQFAAQSDLVVIQRAAYPIVSNSSPELARSYEALNEIGHATLFAAADQQREAAERRQQEVAARVATLEQLAAANSMEKVGSLAFGQPRSAGAISFCTLSYEGERGAAVLGYVYRGLATQSDSFRSEATSARATVDASRPFAKAYPTLEALYEARQTKPNECLVYVDFPANLKRIRDALLREQERVVVNVWIDAFELRNDWAKRTGYADYAEYGLAREMKVNAQQYKSLVGYQVRDRAGLDAVIREMQASRYNSGDGVSDVLAYLKDKAEAAGKPGATALTVKAARERAAQEAAEAQALAEQRRRQEAAREFPYIAVLTCGMGNHINILACFSGGSRGVDTELKLTNGSSVNIYKVYNLREAGRERQDGFYIDLRSNFNLRAQNSDGTLILGLKIIDRATNRVLMEDKAARFGVVAARN